MAEPLWLRNAPFMEWSRIPNTNIRNVAAPDPGFRPPNGANGPESAATEPIPVPTMLAESGCGIKLDGSEIFTMGGGHWDGSSNAVYSIRMDDDVPQWQRRRDPTSPVQTSVSHYADGRPTSRHSYTQINFDNDRNLLVFAGCSASYGNGNSNFRTVDAFNPVTNDWLPAGTYPQTLRAPYAATSSVITPANDIYTLYDDGNLDKLSSATRTWTRIGMTTPTGMNRQMLYDHVRERIVRLDHVNGRRVIDPVTAAYTPITLVGEDEIRVHQHGHAFYCEHLDRYLYVQHGRNDYFVPGPMTLYQIHPETWEISKFVVGGTPPSFSTGHTGVYSRLNYLHKHRCLFYYSNYGDMYILKLAPGQGPVSRDYLSLWGTVRSVSRDFTTAWDRRTSVVSDYSPVWDSENAYVENTYTATYNTGGSVYRGIVFSFSSAGEVSSLYSADWWIGTTVESEFEFLWDTVTDVSADLPSSWNSDGVVSADCTAQWDLTELMSVERNFITAWRVIEFNAVSRDLSPFWVIRTSATRDTSAAWDISQSPATAAWFPRLTDGFPTWAAINRNTVVGDYASLWALAGQASRDFEVSYQVSEFGLIEGGGKLPLLIESDYSPVWGIAGEFEADLSPVWTVHGGLASDKTFAWNTVAGVSRDYPSTWTVENPVGVISRDYSALWATTADVASDYASTWSTIATTEQDFSATWSSAGEVQIDLTADWTVREFVAVEADMAHVWSVLAEAQASYAAMWQVFAPYIVDSVGPGVHQFTVPADLVTFLVPPDFTAFAVPSEAAVSV